MRTTQVAQLEDASRAAVEDREPQRGDTTSCNGVPTDPKGGLTYELASHSPFDIRWAPFVAMSAFLFLVLTFPVVARVLGRRAG